MALAISGGLTAETLAQALVGAGVTISNITYTGSALQTGTFTGGLSAGGVDAGGTSGIGIDTGVILSSGNASRVADPQAPTELSTGFNGAGDADLNLVSGGNTYDTAALSFDFNPGNATTVYFSYVYSTSEYPNSPSYNDGFGIFVNGQNVALLPGDGAAVALSNFAHAANKNLYKVAQGNANPTGYAVQSLDNNIESLSVVLKASVTVLPNQVNHIKFAVADAGDTSVDSFVFIQGGSLTTTNPSNNLPTGAPEISGSAQHGSVLTATAGTLTDADGLGSVGYQWQRDDGQGGFADISGATGATLTLTEADVGHRLQVVASYTDGHGTLESVTSAATALTANVNDAPTGGVTIAGGATQGAVLTAANTLADADGLGSITYQWQRDDGQGAFVDISGATGATLTLTEADVGHRVQVVASYTDGHGTQESVASAATALTTNVNDAPNGGVTIAGSAQQGSVLTAGNTLADADGLGSVAYQWQRDDGQGGFANISGATAATYTLAEADVGHRVQVVASYTDGHGTQESVASAATALTTNVNDAPNGGVTIAGSAVRGSVLTAGNTLADADGLGSVTYQWQRDDGQGHYADIAGATGATLTLADADVGHRVQVVASYTDGHGTRESVASAGTLPTAALNNLPTGEVTIVGLLVRGEVLSGGSSLTDEDGMGAVTLRWQRSGDGGYADIGGATGATYTTTRDDIGHSLRLVANYTDGHGAAETVIGAATGPIGARSIPVEPTGGGGSHLTEGLTSTELAARLADGDLLAPAPGRTQIALADGTISFAPNSDAAYLTRLYGGLLERVSDHEGLSYWAHESGGGLDKLQAATAFLESAEYRAGHAVETDAQFVSGLYRSLLGREAEADGFAYFTELLAGGASRAQVLATVADSPEAQAHWSGMTSAGVFVPDKNIGLIRATYETAFGRDAETEGLLYHAGNLKAGATLSELGDAFESSVEFVAMHGAQNDHDFVASLYANGLGRPGSEEEIGYYTAQLESHASDRGDVLITFATSAEGQAHLHWAL
ncbi:choice-of-anchor L domain-containing protein [Muricoccus aerilatus]|uniref:choice-of-anchor L domain-containing protein n=1 Tax=Muricoccus aerilatus TaxID=452982 RepID=UPI0006940C6E|nr:choice-of-anchor L domain-containing protein [Roseomonas aerilata]